MPLAVEVAGLVFPNPVGVAAGFDKDAEVPEQMLGMGFGFVFWLAILAAIIAVVV